MYDCKEYYEYLYYFFTNARSAALVSRAYARAVGDPPSHCGAGATGFRDNALLAVEHLCVTPPA
jgi:hypothetical protein